MSHASPQGLRILIALVALTLPAMARSEYVVEKNGYAIAVKVVPRLGAFDTDKYQESRDKFCAETSTYLSGKLGWNGYEGKLNSTPVPLFYKLPYAELSADAVSKLTIPAWDIITTNYPDGSGACNYGARRVYISVKPKGAVTPAKCVFTLLGKEQANIGGKSAGPCTLYINMRSNQETPFDVKIIPSNGAAPVTVSGTIPEDVLIVSLGDSYASGEGNPDGTESITPEPSSNPDDPWPSPESKAVWMDPWCHRSAYAGPIRAALRILRNPQNITNPRYKSAVEAGALTVVSFACSGGWIANGLDGWYDGVQPRHSVAEVYQTSNSNKAKKAFGPALRIPPQTLQLHTFLSSQRATGGLPKTNIDLLLLSGGGNDVLFVPIIEGIIWHHMLSAERKPLVSNAVKKRFADLEISYRAFADKFRNNVFRYNGEQYAVLSAILTQYPDPTFKTVDSNCIGTLEQGSEGLPASTGRVISRFADLKLDENEINFVRHEVIEPLNLLVSRIADEHGWLALDIGKIEAVGKIKEINVKTHGWCLDGKAAFDSQQRWFRSPLDSKKLQFDLNGSFHPTWELNEKLTGTIVAKSFVDAINAEPKWRLILPTPSVMVADETVVPAAPQFTYAEPPGATVFPRVFASAVPGLACEARSTGCAGTAVNNVLGVNGASVDIFADATNSTHRRKYRQTPLMKVRVDALPPELTCRAFPGPAYPCAAATGWTKERQATVVASDLGSGVQAFDLTVSGPGLSNQPVPAQRNADGSLQATINFPADGSYTAIACASDGVGNRTLSGANCYVSFVFNVDSTPLQVTAIMAYGINWLPRSSSAAPVIPVFGHSGHAPTVTVLFNDDMSGLVPGLDCTSASGAGCGHVLAPPSAFWQRQDYQRAYTDAAGHVTSVSYSTVRLPRFVMGNTARTADAWQEPQFANDLSRGLRAALWIEPGLKDLIASQGAETDAALRTLLSDSATQQERNTSAAIVYTKLTQRELGARWLNMLHGYEYAEGDVTVLAGPSCQQSGTAEPVTIQAYQYLRVQTQCAREGHPITMVSLGNQ